MDKRFCWGRVFNFHPNLFPIEQGGVKFGKQQVKRDKRLRHTSWKETTSWQDATFRVFVCVAGVDTDAGEARDQK